MIAAQIAAGLAYMNGPAMKQRIIHYDLKPANILFDQWGEVKITVRPMLVAMVCSLPEAWLLKGRDVQRWRCTVVVLGSAAAVSAGPIVSGTRFCPLPCRTSG